MCVNVPVTSNSTNPEPSWLRSMSPIFVGLKLCIIQWWYAVSSGLFLSLTSMVSSSGPSPHELPMAALGSPATRGCPV